MVFFFLPFYPLGNSKWTVLPIKNGMCLAHVKNSNQFQKCSKISNWIPVSLIGVFDVSQIKKRYQNKNIGIPKVTNPLTAI